MHGRFLPARGAGAGTEASARTIQRRESAGSITASISNTEDMLTAFPTSYIRATI